MDHILTGLDLIVLNTSLGLNLSDIFNPMSAFNYFFFGKGKTNILIRIKLCMQMLVIFASKVALFFYFYYGVKRRSDNSRNLNF